MDQDLRSIQEARDLIAQARAAQGQYAAFSQEKVDAIVDAMASAGAGQAKPLAEMACKETGFGRVESKIQKNLFATRMLLERMQGMKTVGIIRRLENNTIWEIATPMGVVAALIPSTNPTSTAMYKAIIAAKARCGIVMSPHPRAKICTSEALKTVAEAAYSAGAPKGLFGCMTEVTLAGTDELLENRGTDLILATGGSAMVRAAYSKGKPAYGVGSGNVPVYVDRSADIKKAARDILYGASFDWGTLCSTERSIVADIPISSRLKQALKEEKGYFLSDEEKAKLRKIIWKDRGLNVDQVGKSPAAIASMAGFSVPHDTRALIAEVTAVGKEEPLSMETLSPILSYFEEDGWESGCSRCIDVLKFGGIGHTLCLHCTNERIIEEFALTKPSMRIVVNTVAALGSVGYTNNLFPAMTLGPGTIGGSITSDNISPMHLLNIKRLAFETRPINAAATASSNVKATAEKTSPAAVRPMEKPAASSPERARSASVTSRSEPGSNGWMEKIEERLRARAGNAPAAPIKGPAKPKPTPAPEKKKEAEAALPLAEDQIESIIKRFRK